MTTQWISVPAPGLHPTDRPTRFIIFVDMQVSTLTTSTLLERLLSAPSESEVLEFKHARTTYDFDKLGRYFSALSDEANLCGMDRAWLIFGVRDGNHVVVGSQFRIGGKSLRKLKDEVGNHLTPRITFREIYEVDFEDDRLIFQNAGSFIPESGENVVLKNAPETRYRNPFLSAAMVNLDMIDTIGSGIRRMFEIQKDKYFPLPDYDLGRQRVQVTVTGKILDIDYARKLARMDGLAMEDIIMLDKLQKGYELSHVEAKQLKRKQLIEGRRPNYYISSGVAAQTKQKESYIRTRTIASDHYKKLVLDLLDEFGSASRKEIENLIVSMLPDMLSMKQKQDKVKNLLHAMSKRGNTIVSKGRSRSAKWERLDAN